MSERVPSPADQAVIKVIRAERKRADDAKDLLLQVCVFDIDRCEWDENRWPMLEYVPGLREWYEANKGET